MPVEVKQKDCTDSEGRMGDWAVEDEDGEQFGCHKRKHKAKAQRDAINSNLEED